MTDTFTAEKRRKIMASIRGKNTKPELIVRRLLHRSGYRYRIHIKGLPGKPDLYFSKRRKAIFVNGCFWHGHEGCRRGSLPKTNVKFWREKILANKDRDLRKQKELVALGISSVTVWECELRDSESMMRKLAEFLGGARLG